MASCTSQSFCTTVLNMKMRDIAEEEYIRRNLSKVRSYPRWKYTSITGGFLYYLNRSAWIEEVFPHHDGTWSAGRESKGTIRYFKTLQEALDYGIRLVRMRPQTGYRKQVGCGGAY